MKVIIAGSRSIRSYVAVIDAIIKSNFNITEVVSGKADGADRLGEIYADNHNIPIKEFPADWENLTAPGAVIRKNKYGKEYNVNAGFTRNREMANYADALIAIWDGRSSGTLDMIRAAEKRGLHVYIYRIP
jgi:YspA, cpYpsA-related SLOG family